jgi:hypothetical protein
MEELRRELAARGIGDPRVIGVTSQLPDHKARTERKRLEAFFAR